MWHPPFHQHRGWFGPPWARFPRARRGDVRAALLRLLSERPMHGYDVIRELEARSGGLWRPSPGSVYPTLQLLEDEGLVAAEEREGRRVYSLTEAGRAAVRDLGREGAAPWEVEEVPEELTSLRRTAFQLGAAAMQIASTGSPEQVRRATEALAEARRTLYGILAEG